MKNIERRYSNDDNEFRAFEEDNKKIIFGYAAKFGKESRMLFDFNKGTY